MEPESSETISLGCQPFTVPPSVAVPAHQFERLDQLAARAMGALIQASARTEGDNLHAIEPALVARYAYAYAHAMLEERRRNGGQ